MQDKTDAPRGLFGRLGHPGKGHPFYIHIGTLFMLLVLVVQLSNLLAVRMSTESMVLSSADLLFERVADETVLEIRSAREPIEMAVNLTAQISALELAKNLDSRLAQLPALTTALASQPQMDAIYIAYETGDFFLVRPVRTETDRAYFKVPKQSAFLVQSVEDSGRRARWLALDASLGAVWQQDQPELTFDPRIRPWYLDAMRSQKLVRTQPYVFATTQTLGRTVALRTLGGKAVIGADLSTNALSQRLKKSLMTPSAEMVIFDSDTGVLAYSDPSRVAVQNAQGQFVRSQLENLSTVMSRVKGERDAIGNKHRINIDGRDWLVKTAPLLTSVSKDFLLLAAPVDELMAEATAIENRLLAITISILVLTLPMIWWVSRGIASQLKDLMAQAAAIRRFDFQTDFPIASRVLEIFELGRSMQRMKETVQKFLDVSTALASERNFDNLMTRVLQEVCEAAAGDGGVIYLFNEGSGKLKFGSQRWSPGRPNLTDTHPDLDLNDPSHIVFQAARQSGAPTQLTLPSIRPVGLEYLSQRYGDDAVQMLVIPLLGRTGYLVGVICAFIPPGSAAPSRERMALVKAFAGAAAVSIDQQTLLQSQKDLLSAFIGLVAGAIDSKSPYTGGHCQRVPELTEMLVQAAHTSQDPAFVDFSLNDAQKEAVHIAAWLHDCGKVTTPEYVVDKATKLETIYNRIHEVRMRFEVLKRDAEIATLKAIAAGGNALTLHDDLKAAYRQLDAEFQFIATCNEGGEFMSADAIERLKTIGKRSWQRTLDDRLGASWEERLRMARTPPVALPAQELLLSDKPAHVIERDPTDMMPDRNPWGFKLKVPRNLYNRGELYNLSVVRGTLTEEERYKINDHIVQTIVMLSKLPFPHHLKNVAELAGGHHEKMDGTGYPKRLTRSELSVPARIMAVADIFEALTATDRPYKKGKKLSETIKIMDRMVKDQHIDPDVFKLLLSSGIYLDYAQKYLSPELVDEVNLNLYLQEA